MSCKGPIPSSAYYFTSLLSGAYALVSTIAHVLVILVIVLDPLKQLRKSLDLWLLNIALADMIIASLINGYRMYSNFIRAIGEDTRKYIANQSMWGKLCHVNLLAVQMIILCTLAAIFFDQLCQFQIKLKRNTSYKLIAAVSLAIWLTGFGCSVLYIVYGFKIMEWIVVSVSFVGAVIGMASTYLLLYRPALRSIKKRGVEEKQELKLGIVKDCPKGEQARFDRLDSDDDGGWITRDGIEAKQGSSGIKKDGGCLKQDGGKGKQDGGKERQDDRKGKQDGGEKKQDGGEKKQSSDEKKPDWDRKKHDSWETKPYGLKIKQGWEDEHDATVSYMGSGSIRKTTRHDDATCMNQPNIQVLPASAIAIHTAIILEEDTKEKQTMLLALKLKYAKALLLMFTLLFLLAGSAFSVVYMLNLKANVPCSSVYWMKHLRMMFVISDMALNPFCLIIFWPNLSRGVVALFRHRGRIAAAPSSV